MPFIDLCVINSQSTKTRLYIIQFKRGEWGIKINTHTLVCSNMVVGRRVMYQWTATINQGFTYVLGVIQKDVFQKNKNNVQQNTQTLNTGRTQYAKNKNLLKHCIPLWMFRFFSIIFFC